MLNQGFSSEALAQCHSAADVEHKLEELEDLHHVSWSCIAWLGRLLRLSELLVQDLADDIGMDLEDLYACGGEDDPYSDSDSDESDDVQRECLDFIALKRYTRSLLM